MVWQLIRENSIRNMFWLTKRCTCTSYELTDISINTSCCKKTSWNTSWPRGCTVGYWLVDLEIDSSNPTGVKCTFTY